jgi:hypothetical protein
MRIVSANEFEHWLQDGQVLEKDGRGPKVIRLKTGCLLKIFRSRRPALIARLQPDAQRFADRAERLRQLGIRTPDIIETCWLNRESAISLCIYSPLPGRSLEHIFLDSRDEFDRLLPGFAEYIRMLHRCGVYFRSLHLGNVLHTPDGGFGLIDFLDIRFKKRALGRHEIKRNFNHLHSYLDRRKIHDFPWHQLMRTYETISRRDRNEATKYPLS